MGFVIFRPSCQSSWVVILGHIPSGRVFLHHYLGHPLVLGHLIRSFIILLVQFESGPHLYRSVIRCVNLSRDCTYINRSSSYQFEFESGTAPISISHHLISLSVSRGSTYIDRPSPYHVSSVSWNWPHQYWSVIILSVWVWVRAAPISIGHLLVMSV